MRRRSSAPPAVRLFHLALAVVLLAGLAACGDAEDEASIEERLAEKGTMEVMEEAGKAEYDPPRDGELSEAQIEQYLEVQRRAAKIRQVAEKKLKDAEQQGGGDEEGDGSVWSQMRNVSVAMQGFGDVMTAEIRAAQELGHNPKEYQWVKGKILEAMAASAMMEMQSGMGEAQRNLLESLEEQRDATENEEQRALLDEQIDRMRQSMGEAEEGELEPGVEENIELVKRYEEEIAAAHEAKEEAA